MRDCSPLTKKTQQDQTRVKAWQGHSPNVWRGNFGVTGLLLSLAESVMGEIIY